MPLHQEIFILIKSAKNSVYKRQGWCPCGSEMCFRYHWWVGKLSCHDNLVGMENIIH